MRVLIVEDEVLLALDWASMVEDQGCIVVGPAHNLQKGLEFASSHEFDFALLDVNLGNDDSLPIADQLHSKSIPFCFLSGYGRVNIPPRFHEIPLVEKPCKPDALGAVLRNASHT